MLNMKKSMLELTQQYWQEEVVVEYPKVEDFKQLIEDYENSEIFEN